MENILKFKYDKGKQEVFPENNLVKNWLFDENEHDEAALAHFMGKIGEKNGLNANDMSHLFPYVLRMLKSEIPWSK